MGHFLPPPPPTPPLKNPRNQNFEKILKKMLQISSFYKCTTNHNQMRYFSWDTEWDRHNFLSLCTFGKNVQKTWRYCFTQVYHKWRSYGICFLRYKAQQSFFCHLGPFFALYPPNNPKNQNFEKKMLGNIITLHICTIII